MTVTNFFWDELSDNVLLETDENDVVTASYTNRPERFGELLSQKRSGVTSYFHYDGQYSTRNLTDSAEDVTDTFIYTAYGEEVARTGTTTNPFGYKGAAGYYANESTGDIYVRNRSYEPTIGRWMSKDPLGFVDGTNLYRAYFVPNEIDYFGLCIGCWVENWETTEQECGIYQLDGRPPDMFVKPFENHIEFGGPCKCCRYQQWITCDVIVTFHDRNGNEVHRIVNEKKGEFYEDEGSGGVYGDRNDENFPRDFYSDDYERSMPNRESGCFYYNEDFPGFRDVDALLAQVPRAFTVVLHFDCDFRLLVIDTCGNPDPITLREKSLNTTCTSEPLRGKL